MGREEEQCLPFAPQASMLFMLLSSRLAGLTEGTCSHLLMMTLRPLGVSILIPNHAAEDVMESES